MNRARQTTSPGADDQRLVLTVDIPDGQANEKVAIDALITLVRHLEFDAIYPTFMALEFGQVPASR